MGSAKRALRRQVAKKTAEYLVNGSVALEDELTGAKAWWVSKTLWVNLLALLALFIQRYTGFIVDGELQAAVLVVINLVLRLVTSKPIAARDQAVARKAAAGAALGLVVAVALLLTSCASTFTCTAASLELSNGAYPGDTHLEVSCDGNPVLQLEARGLSLGGPVSGEVSE